MTPRWSDASRSPDNDQVGCTETLSHRRLLPSPADTRRVFRRQCDDWLASEHLELSLLPPPVSAAVVSQLGPSAAANRFRTWASVLI